MVGGDSFSARRRYVLCALRSVMRRPDTWSTWAFLCNILCTPSTRCNTTQVYVRVLPCSTYHGTRLRVHVYGVTKRTSVQFVGVVCLGTHDQGSDTNPKLAAETYAAVKAAKYADQDHFIPFILETGGRVNKAAREWLDTLLRRNDYDRRNEPARRAHDDRDRHQGGDAGPGARAAHILARIVVEIRSAELSVEEEPYQ
jgi:hypothetical protein